MRCPGCSFEIERTDAWICPKCSQVLDASRITAAIADLAPPVWDDDSTIVSFETDSMEARIVENITIDESFEDDDDARMMTGFDIGENGHVSSIAYYSAGTSRVIRHTAVPRTTPRADETISTPYQEHILELIDGSRTVQMIIEYAKLAPREVAIALLSLFDDGLIKLDGIDSADSDLDELDEDEFEEIPVTPAPIVAAPAPPVLSASYLLELSVPAEPGPPPEIPRLSEPPPMEAPAPAVERARPVRARNRTPAPAEPPPPPPPRKATTPWGQRAETLYEKALQDRDAGNLLSAQMNIKLALTFEPTNETYRTIHAKLTTEVQKSSTHETADRGEQAKALYAKATECEKIGDIEGAVEVLEKAIGFARQPRIMNRLGVMIAMRQGKLEAGRTWIVEAVAKSPSNQLYQKNLIKVDRAIAQQNKKAKRRSLLGLFGRDRK